MPLTDSIARNAKPAAKTIRIFDHDGLYLEVSPRGGKWWRLKYRYAGMHTRLTRIVDDRRRPPFATFAASCDCRGPALGKPAGA